MTKKAEELLSKLIEENTNNGTVSFDSTFYMGYDDSVLIELYNDGYIEIINDIIGSIELLIR